MITLLSQNPIVFIITAGLLIIAISIHEFSHAFAADRLGDPTARISGRLTLNPLAHLDPIGTLLLLFVGFGWGKPVPFDPFNLKNHVRDAAIISFAGPLSNFVMAVVAGILFRIISQGQFTPSLLEVILAQFIYFNVLLGVFNLIPVHPLDGFKVVAGLLPRRLYEDWMSLASYGMIFLIFLIFPFFGHSAVSTIISPIVNFFISILIPISTTVI